MLGNRYLGGGGGVFVVVVVGIDDDKKMSRSTDRSCGQVGLGWDVGRKIEGRCKGASI